MAVRQLKLYRSLFSFWDVLWAHTCMHAQLGTVLFWRNQKFRRDHKSTCMEGCPSGPSRLSCMALALPHAWQLLSQLWNRSSSSIVATQLQCSFTRDTFYNKNKLTRNYSYQLWRGSLTKSQITLYMLPKKQETKKTKRNGKEIQDSRVPFSFSFCLDYYG